MNERARMPPRERAVLIALCLLAQLVVLFSAPLLFSNDGPQHLLSSYMFAHPELAAADWTIVHPVTDNGYRQVFWLVESFVGWRHAHAIAVWLPLAIGLMGWLMLATEARAGAIVKAALLTGVSIPWHYWIGLLPFLYSTAFVPFVYFLIRHGGRQQLLLASFCMMAQTMCHPFPVMVSGAIFVVTRPSWRQAAAVALSGVPAGVVALTVAVGSVHSEAGGVVWELEPDPFRQLLSQYVPGPQSYRVFLTFTLIALIVVCWRRRNQLGREQRAVVLVAVVLIVATPLLPFSANGWELVRARLLPTAVPFLIATTPLVLPAMIRSVVGVGAVAYAASTLVWVQTTTTALETAYGDIYDGVVATMPPVPGLVWQLDIFDTAVAPEAIPEIDYYGGTAHMAQVVALTKLGQPNFTQATDDVLHGIMYRKKLRMRPGQGEQELGGALAFWGQLHDNPHRRAVELTSYLAHNYPVDVLIAVGLATDEAALIAAGYDVRTLGKTAAGLNVYEAHYTGCSPVLTFEAGGADVIEIGVLPQGGAVEIFPVTVGTNTVSLQQVPCGTWWIRGAAKVGDTAYDHDVVEVRSTTDAVSVRHGALMPPGQP